LNRGRLTQVVVDYAAHGGYTARKAKAGLYHISEVTMLALGQGGQDGFDLVIENQQPSCTGQLIQRKVQITFDKFVEDMQHR
jgi:hypothetical protein